jgi:pyruvate/2-oxoglutarate dehydrogenase complex dihydrolipoamide dehydrogenase (E3) component
VTLAMTREEPLDVLVIGGGQAGIPLAHALVKKGLRVALAERKQLGGSCVNFGCTPTKAAIASARVAALARRADEFGLRVGEVQPDFPRVLARARDIAMQSRAGLRDSFRRKGAPQLMMGHARLEGREGKVFRIRVGRRTVRAKEVVIDTGTRTLVPPIPGLSELPYLDAENWLDGNDLPSHLIVLGGGYTGLEMGQFYRRMGSRVTVVERSAEIADREDPEVGGALRQFLESEEIAFRLNARVSRVRRTAGGIQVRIEQESGHVTLDATHLFVATGRKPNTDDLGLETVGLKTSRDGFLEVNGRLATRVKGIWAAGDVRGGPMFTHTAWDDYRVLLSQLAGDRKRTTDRVLPYAIYTDPQLGRVGWTEREAQRKGRRVRAARFEMRKNGKAREIGEPGGFIKVIADRKSGLLLGAAIVAAEAAELVHVYVTLMNARAPYRVLREAVFIHPTLAEATQSAAAELDEES